MCVKGEKCFLLRMSTLTPFKVLFARFSIPNGNSPRMPSISFIGTGSGLPTPDRFFSSSLLFIDGLHLLIDAGEPCVHSLRDRGTLVRDIDAVLITHGHVDHIGGLPALLQGAMLLGRVKPLVLCLPAEMIAPVRAWIRALYLTEEAFGFPVEWRPWVDGERMLFPSTTSHVCITPHANGHLAASYRSLPGADAALACNSFSLEIFWGQFRALFSGDLSSAVELSRLAAEPSSVLISELSHFDADQMADALKSAELTALCLVHLSEEYALNREELRVKMEKLLPQVADVFVPEEGEVLDF